jgi:hypothetical protein
MKIVWFIILSFMIGMYFAIEKSHLSCHSLLLGGFSQWRTGYDDLTIQILPATGYDPLVRTKGNSVTAHVKFKVNAYGEMSFPINSESIKGDEALKADISDDKFVVVTYRSNQNVVLQLRQTGVHGGRHNHVTLQEAGEFRTDTIYFAEFRNGLQPLDLTDVAKFNFALLSNNAEEGYAELEVRAFVIGK